MLREDISSSVADEIKDIVEGEFEEIKLLAKKEGIKDDPEWKERTSFHYLSSIIERDIDVCESGNAYRFSKHLSNKLVHIVKELYPEKSVYSSGHFYYPPGGHMGWHPNYKEPDERLYLTFANKGRQSFFRYKDGDNVVTDYDDEGLTVRRFSPSAIRPYFWHCVGSECDRFSFGYRLCATI